MHWYSFRKQKPRRQLTWETINNQSPITQSNTFLLIRHSFRYLYEICYVNSTGTSNRATSILPRLPASTVIPSYIPSCYTLVLYTQACTQRCVDTHHSSGYLKKVCSQPNQHFTPRSGLCHGWHPTAGTRNALVSILKNRRKTYTKWTYTSVCATHRY